MIEVADCPTFDIDSEEGKLVEARLRLGDVGGWCRKMGTVELHWRRDEALLPKEAACGRRVRPGRMLGKPGTPRMKYCAACTIHFLGSS